MLRLLLALARREWFWLLVAGIAGAAAWCVATTEAPGGLPARGPEVLMWRLKMASPLATWIALSGVGLWLQPRWRHVLLWLLEPLRRWAGLGPRRGPEV